MPLRRRLLAAAPLLALPVLARAQSGAMRLVVPNAPGGTSDILARLIAEPLGRALGGTVIVENRAGAGGNIGADLVAKSTPDGTTMLLLDVSVLETFPSLLARMPYDVERDLAPVQMLIYAPYILAVANRLPVQDARALAAHVKANTGRVSAANSGAGTLTHIVALSLASHWGGEMIHVPYRGGAPALLAVASGESDLTMAGATQSQPYVTGGQMRGVAVSGRQRLTAVPDLPTFAELGWPLPESGTWQGLLVQGQTPPAIVARLEAAVAEVLAMPAVRSRIAELGGVVQADGAAAFRARLQADTAALSAIIRTNNIRMDN
ncbi:tripartite tricarboxylate transporter substrate binding protein [Siccirubricoccus sp. KC 17139]|uniref:Tripartite tricarboxylate transporter substrate binding protein n=1 Tax=Siccirubricoccus soli TaxID=2899147 RepID=A0ABT1D5L2_9PROT|nr:tripartite tricarboxylate transporter substrate binding protein [Siccirubricoccus soli]MCO6417216.1 tripartite tricarboxylate transporter substrate binding protein [Siccirubricoccus soli]MCP2683351.1 tripartite tricarboxylate transporter substrate binding protein [Siccirubricoccus soli]